MRLDLCRTRTTEAQGVWWRAPWWQVAKGRVFVPKDSTARPMVQLRAARRKVASSPQSLWVAAAKARAVVAPMRA
eukprot:459716-Prymnesium_polylepis.1